MLNQGTLLQERFLIEERIGLGGMGAVYLATDQKFGSRVAIKETFYENRELREAFEREARLLNSLHHPVLPHVSDHFTDGEESFLVMEYIEGDDVSEILKRGAIPVFDDVMRWTFELLDALEYLHSQDPPIIHRDIKPNNLKVTTRGHIVLLDFGLAKETSGNTLGMKSVFGYSRRYSPLEQIEGTGTDTRSDLFALGATVFHLLTGQPPVDVLARASAIVAGRPDPLRPANELNPDVPSDFAYIIHSALALNADLRFASARAMRNALEAAIGMGAVSEPEHSDVTEAVFTAAVPMADTESIAAMPEPAASFAALEAFKDDSESGVRDDIPAISHDEDEDGPSPVVTAANTVPPRRLAGGLSGLMNPLVLAAFVILASIIGYGIYRSNASSTVEAEAVTSSEVPVQEEPSGPVDAQTPAETTDVPDLTVNEPKNTHDAAPHDTSADRDLDTAAVRRETVKDVRPNDKRDYRSSNTETKAKEAPEPPRTSAKKRPAAPGRNPRPSVSDIEMILTGVPTDPYRSGQWRPRRVMDDDEYRRRRQMRNRYRNYPPY